MFKPLTILILVAVCQSLNGQTPFPLYKGKVPNATTADNREYVKANELVDSLTFDVTVPSFAFYPRHVDRSSRKAIIIIPGGGYQVLLTRREGSFVANEFNKLGYSCFVLKYRLPNDAYMRNKHVVPLQDLQQVIKTVRENATQWDIDPDSVGIMGFSAGGHLVATGVTHFDTSLVENSQQISLRPAFGILINPVISFSDTFGHRGTAQKLLGNQFGKKMSDYFSAEKNVKEATPPCLLIHSNEDVVVPVENSVSFYRALRLKNISSAIHVYSRGEHGLLSAPPFEEWFHNCIYWLEKELGSTEKRKSE